MIMELVFQDVAIKETLAARGRPLRKATSVPNIHNVRHVVLSVSAMSWV